MLLTTAFVADPKLVSDTPKMKINGKPVNLCDNLDDFDYKALYPSIIDENNMAPNTQHGKVFFPERLDDKENRFNNDYFDRTVWFMEDLNSHNWIDFCERYLHLAGYQQMYEDVIRYFTEVKNPARGLQHIDPNTGKRIMCRIINPEQKREMVHIVDPSKGRTMCVNQERIVPYDFNSK